MFFLSQLISGRRNLSLSGVTGVFDKPHLLIFVLYVTSCVFQNGLKDCLIQRIPKLLNSGTVGLLIIDSIAAVFRSEYSFSDGNQRTKDLRTIGLQLHSFSRKYNLCILCVNQVRSISIMKPSSGYLISSRTAKLAFLDEGS